jgi:hypothetical protein
VVNLLCHSDCGNLFDAAVAATVSRCRLRTFLAIPEFRPILQTCALKELILPDCDISGSSPSFLAGTVLNSTNASALHMSHRDLRGRSTNLFEQVSCVHYVLIPKRRYFVH